MKSEHEHEHEYRPRARQTGVEWKGACRALILGRDLKCSTRLGMPAHPPFLCLRISPELEAQCKHPAK